MENTRDRIPEDNKLRVAAAAYYAGMLAAFAMGVYGVFSLLWLAGAEFQRSGHILSSLR